MTTCPYCDGEIDFVDNVQCPERNQPKAGAWFVCLSCGSISRFLSPGVLAAPLVDEFADMDAGERAWICALRNLILIGIQGE